METSKLLSSIGLIVDIIGVILIYIFGISSKLDIDGNVNLIGEQEDKKEKILARKYKKLSDVGLGLLCLGFTLQLAGNLSTLASTKQNNIAVNIQVVISFIRSFSDLF